MLKVSPIAKSPIAQYLIKNKARPIRDEHGCHFISPEGCYLGCLKKGNIGDFRVINLDIFGAGNKKLYTKSIAVSHEFVYAKMDFFSSGIGIIPIKSVMRKVFVDFFNQTTDIKDTETSLKNPLESVVVDKETGVCLYETTLPFKSEKRIISKKQQKFKSKSFSIH